MNRRWWVAVNVSIGVFMSTLDASVVNISLPTITQSFHTQLKVVAWVVTAYLIVITGCLLIMGRLTDLLGQRKIYLVGFSTFTLGSAFCGLSPTIHSLILSRIVQGLGVGLASSFLALSRNLGMAIGIAFAEMIIALRTVSSGQATGGPSLESLQYVWKSVLVIGLVAVLFSWTRKKTATP